MRSAKPDNAAQQCRVDLLTTTLDTPLKKQFLLITAITVTGAIGIASSFSVFAARQYPSCTNNDSDTDGDGWGWENFQTCTTKDTTSDTDTDTDTGNQSKYPTCTTDNADSNGDGWGFENGKTCLVAADALAGGSTGNTTKNHPTCASDITDTDNDGWGYENHKSCIVIPATGAATGTATSDIIYSQTFSNASIGLYQGDQLNSTWKSPLWHLGFDQGRVKIVKDTSARDKVMQVTYPAGAYGAGGASAFLSDVQFGMALPKSYTELYLAYDIKFDHNFEFVLGGKLPGLCGYDINQSPATGCNTGGGFPSGYDGWSARGMWRADGALENYVYHAGQTSYYGDEKHWNTSAVPGTWHRIQHRIVLNTPGLNNGLLEAWFDGSKVLSVNTMEYRKTDSIGINLFYFSTFFGGNNSSWAPSTEQRIFFDNFAISTKKIP